MSKLLHEQPLIINERIIYDNKKAVPVAGTALKIKVFDLFFL